MPWLSLIPWRAVGILAVLIGVFGYGYYGGVKHEREKQQVIAAKQIADVLKDERARQAVSVKTDTNNQIATEKIRTVTKTITKVIRSEQPDASCSLSGRWIGLYNSSIANKEPDQSGEYGTGTTANLALEAIVENNSAYNESRQIAVDCQAWIREQQAISAQ